ncbi:MAG: hemerythrin domain-containing protein [Acidobacteriaceae bacterium]|nr:hemerythrin domain-containing protein [Acidobacteriaceae bacterium]
MLPRTSQIVSGTAIAADEAGTLKVRLQLQLSVTGGAHYMDATELLTKDHEAVRQLFEEFESGESNDSKLDAYEDLRQQLLIHARIEEEIFYPAIREADPGKAENPVKEALTEHQQVKQMLAKLDEMAAEVDADFDESVKQLAKSVEHHVQEEENDIFRVARKMGKQQLGELGDRLQQRKNELMNAGMDEDDQSAPQ